ncbi:MAG: hypothetical protein ACI807_002094 [Paracoccaceae bacterium]|jgi:hypothetical protein
MRSGLIFSGETLSLGRPLDHMAASSSAFAKPRSVHLLRLIEQHQAVGIRGNGGFRPTAPEGAPWGA